MTQAQTGQQVKVHYTGKLEDGTVFDSSRQREPLEFTLGQRQVIPGFDEAVEGMSVGETKTAHVPADKAYGPRRDDLVVDVPDEQLPESLEPQVGQKLQVRQPDGQVVDVAVTKVGDDGITIDANHPLAGKDLTFDIELVEVA